MGIYEFAGCVVSYEPLYGLLRRRMETYRSDTERQPDITLDGTKEDYEKLRKQYPHLSIEECEYSCCLLYTSTRLFDKGYRPKHLNLEKEWTLGHESKGGRADICVSDQEGNTLFIVECKTYGREYEKEYKNIVNDGGQLFSYWQQERSCKFLVLYASKYEGLSLIHI